MCPFQSSFLMIIECNFMRKEWSNTIFRQVFFFISIYYHICILTIINPILFSLYYRHDYETLKSVYGGDMRHLKEQPSVQTMKSCDHTPNSMKSIIDDISQNLNTIHILTQKQLSCDIFTMPHSHLLLF